MYDTKAIDSHQKISGTTNLDLSVTSGSLPAEPTKVNLVMDFTITRNPADAAVVFSTGPGSSDSLNLTIDSYRNLYVEFGQRASDGEIQVIKLMESASYGSVHRIKTDINLENLTAILSADERPVIATEARPGRTLDLGRARVLVCSPTFPPDRRENGFEGDIKSMELALNRTSSTSSLRSMNAFLLLGGLALSLRVFGSKRKNK